MVAEVTLVSAFPIKSYGSERAGQKAELAASAFFLVEKDFAIPWLKCTCVTYFNARGTLAMAAENRNTRRKNFDAAQAIVLSGASNFASVARDAPFGANQNLISHGFLLSPPGMHLPCRLGCGLLGPVL